MEAVRFFVKLILSVLFLLLAQADSILFSSPIINHYFTHSQSYLYTAAHLDNPQANYQLYLQTNDPTWLKKAASLNHIKAVYQWYLIQHEQEHISQQVWLQQAINLGYAPAMLVKLSELTSKKDWEQASIFKQEHNQSLAKLQGKEKKQYQNIQALLALSLRKQNKTQPTQKLKIDNNKFTPKTESVLKCEMTIQTVAESEALLSKAAQYENAFKQSKINNLPICFLPAKTLPELSVFCELDKFNRIDCDLDLLAQTLITDFQTNSHVNPVSYNRLLVIVEQGNANTRGGLMYLDKNDSGAVFIHELAHWLGYIDEYQINQQQQSQLCKVTRAQWISPNLFVTPNSISKQEAERVAGETLYPANTCRGSGFNAYKIMAKPSFMEYLDLPLSERYAQKIQRNSTNTFPIADTLPISMNFWVHYSELKDKATDKIEKQFNNQQYLAWLKVAAAQKYTVAMTLLAQYYIATDAYTAAYTLLQQSAELGNANAQLLLGHGFIEGRWLPQDVNQSSYWYKQAADQNDPYGLYFYAKCHEMGWGCELSLEKSINYYKQAKALGNTLAIKRLAVLQTP